jgi:exodeoxyribonuclease VII large subunit
MSKILSVSELTSYVRGILEGSELLQNFWLVGELSNFKAHSSGHLYFTLKDEQASIKAVMWRSRAMLLKFRPVNGMKLLVRGSIGVYERDGAYQLYVTQMQPEGIGALHLAYEQLKQQLAHEGFFELSRKRPLPSYPEQIALLTSPTGAVVRDVLTILGRRYPQVKVLILPIAVQGALAVESIVEAFDKVAQLPEIDVVILARGGGSLEELWSFNEEAVARAIANCTRPVISAVGHETDTTIADFVADLRAPTPSAAAEVVVPDRRELYQRCQVMSNRLSRELQRMTRQLSQRVDDLDSRLRAKSPKSQIRDRVKEVERLKERITVAVKVLVAARRAKLDIQVASLEALSPLKVLARGYTVTRRAQGGLIVSPRELNAGEELVTIFSDGQVTSIVVKKE